MNGAWNKYSWLYVRGCGERLHFVGSVTEWTQEMVDGGGLHLRAACGLRAQMALPGVLARLGRPRCKRCCKAIGITQGNGCPANDKTCQEVA